MIGAIIGDMVGAPYEFDQNNVKRKDFQFWSEDSTCTDDSVMSIAVADALLSVRNQDDDCIKETVVQKMKEYGRRYPYAGYGAKFRFWLLERNPKPYGSFGNGSAMRVSSVAWLCDDGTIEKIRHIARLTAEVSHNHPEGIKGAEATASAIWLSKHGKNKEEIKSYIEQEFHYDLNRTCDEIRPEYRHVESCQESVPEAIIAFLEGTDYEDVIRTAVSIGGDSDTIACIAGGIAEAYYGVPEELQLECMRRMPDDLLDVLLKVKKAREGQLK